MNLDRVAVNSKTMRYDKAHIGLMYEKKAKIQLPKTVFICINSVDPI